MENITFIKATRDQAIQLAKKAFEDGMYFEVNWLIRRDRKGYLIGQYLYGNHDFLKLAVWGNNPSCPDWDEWLIESREWFCDKSFKEVAFDKIDNSIPKNIKTLGVAIHDFAISHIPGVYKIHPRLLEIIDC